MPAAINFPPVPRIGARQYADRGAFTIVEAVVAMAILSLFAVGSIYGLMSFNDRAARNRNAEAARTILENYVDALLIQNTVPPATALGTDLDGDGIGDGVLSNPGIPLIVQRNTTATATVSGDLYTLVQPVGTMLGLTNATDVMGVQYMLRYTYRGQIYTFKILTFKSAT